ncbi:hypothetical protein [Streptomyces sp. CB01635]|uniref:hypothetical protein n=1 Tax=unclassified Streptomyces TaxID=2593676 RepID=UPI001F2533E0|nr:hypothetical protein [Streptomyces sp. CB01635]
MTQSNESASAVASTQMRMNHLAPLDGGGSSPSTNKDLASSPAQKKKAAEAIEKHLEPDTRRDGAQARESTVAAAREFEGWLTGPALKTARKTWNEQLTTLMNRLGSEKAALRATNTIFQNTDTGVELGIRKSSALDAF